MSISFSSKHIRSTAHFSYFVATLHHIPPSLLSNGSYLSPSLAKNEIITTINYNTHTQAKQLSAEYFGQSPHVDCAIAIRDPELLIDHDELLDGVFFFSVECGVTQNIEK